jgi:hypothetical protein
MSRRRPWTLLIVSLAVIGACKSSPEDQRQKNRQELASWNATAQLTRELSRRGAVPQVYVRQVDEAVEQGKQKIRQQQAKSSQ